MSDDLISREALRRAMYHEAMEKDSDEQKWDSGCWIRYKMFERVLEAQPPAEPQRKRGHWVFDERAGGYFCSECGRETYDSHDEPFEDPMFGKGIALVLPYYCGYCGAKMITDKDDTQ